MILPPNTLKEAPFVYCQSYSRLIMKAAEYSMAVSYPVSVKVQVTDIIKFNSRKATDEK